MAAYNALSVALSASSLAGPVFRPQRSSKLVSVAPSPSLLPSPSLIPFSPKQRPNKAELEARLSGAHVRAYNRRLRQSLGHGKPPASATQRTARAVAHSFPRGSGGAAPATTTGTTAPASPLCQVAFPRLGKPITIPSAPSPSMLPPPPATPRPLFHCLGKPITIASAPSPSMLPPPPATPRPLFPRRRSRQVPARGPVVGLGLSLGASAPLSFSEEDAPLTPHHVFPATLRRTPGAPLRAKQTQEVVTGTSYFHLPGNVLNLAPGAKGQAAVGLGIVGLNLGHDTGVQQPFPVLL
ncbi:hypothetical protein BD414DRAFT_538536 [Trametes punicea]|nr:hypothetical protein BD414DRAFT_538536 [Trametes punicea]